jgi:hypothetical protein
MSDNRNSTTDETDIRAGDIRWLASGLQRIWTCGQRGIKEHNNFEELASSILRCLDGYAAPESSRDPVEVYPARVRFFVRGDRA